ncbi:2,3-bisphosphoglycerate-independent phosphoglycerate mutase [Flavilitoribacter nigricans]|uniref:2,3-bisphosphoglycerate-independent phosphoglycerate mutase n=1 Tax=Flavilitoribacter nigricans (strain ATCC 23147 / DSM 23189 / NBRC 102662 / NCIMB 1420 / SS-2) TaxID=1122177 RepID=A0A2D0N1Z1_FLAN2|nr:phosphoglycerate mutase (2,3-diphosphoglycerate-independent) [Flavilitoribacter nigricans DSM 23189 = NBRC 102662]
MEKQKVILVILDGWGLGPDPARSAIAQGNTPYVDSLFNAYPHAELITFGEEVGLPEGQMGNSEVGHLNIGAGRIVYQELARINKAIRDGEFQKNETLVNALQAAKEKGSNVHFMGLLSDGGVHSHINHLKALCDVATNQGLENVFIHAFLDGRDCDPKSGAGFLEELQGHITGQPVQLASVIGRYYAMDRDNRWERIKLAYDLMVKGEGEATQDAVAVVKSKYDAGETDEFIKPIVCVDDQESPIATLADGDLLICFNFRTDRPREISEVLTQSDKPEHGMHKLNVDYVTMTRYDESFRGVQVLFTKDNLKNTLGEVLAKAERSQVRIAETEKYPHVTFFFSGGRENEFPHERRILIPSPKVATYDLQPEMSALQITAAITADIREHQPDFICLNYANTDMVGHTGDFEAAKVAAETVDDCLRELMDVALAHDYVAIVIADHGNSDYMINEDGSPNTAHTTNPVPVFYLSKDQRNLDLKNGKLGDIAPTILTLMGIPIPPEMDGQILLNR